MFTLEDIRSILDVLELELVTLSDNEIDGYEYGSYYIPVHYRGGLQFLELYVFVLSHVADILDSGLDYTDFGITDSQISYVINKCNELTFFYD